jgi:hypothetical protein
MISQTQILEPGKLKHDKIIFREKPTKMIHPPRHKSKEQRGTQNQAVTETASFK